MLAFPSPRYSSLSSKKFFMLGENQQNIEICVKALETAISEEETRIKQGKQLISEYETLLFAAELHKRVFLTLGLDDFKQEAKGSMNGCFSPYQKDMLDRCARFTSLSNKEPFPRNLLKTMKHASANMAALENWNGLKMSRCTLLGGVLHKDLLYCSFHLTIVNTTRFGFSNVFQLCAI